MSIMSVSQQVVAANSMDCTIAIAACYFFRPFQLLLSFWRNREGVLLEKVVVPATHKSSQFECDQFGNYSLMNLSKVAF